jgi:hypothetical protein
MKILKNRVGETTKMKEGWKRSRFRVKKTVETIAVSFYLDKRRCKKERYVWRAGRGEKKTLAEFLAGFCTSHSPFRN